MEIHRVGTELLQADSQKDRQTDMTNLVVAFRNFANGPKKPKHLKTFAERGQIMRHYTNKRHLNTISNEKIILPCTIP
jgi:hypothetical protein